MSFAEYVLTGCLADFNSKNFQESTKMKQPQDLSRQYFNIVFEKSQTQLNLKDNLNFVHEIHIFIQLYVFYYNCYYYYFDFLCFSFYFELDLIFIVLDS